MKANVRKLIGMAVLGLAMLSNDLPTWAGAKDTPEVTVAPNFAEGSMVGARYNADSQQYIGCSFENRSGPSVVCFAQDKTGKNYVCYKNDAKWASAVKSINDFSFLRFGRTAIGSCDSLTVENRKVFQSCGSAIL